MFQTRSFQCVQCPVSSTTNSNIVSSPDAGGSGRLLSWACRNDSICNIITIDGDRLNISIKWRIAWSHETTVVYAAGQSIWLASESISSFQLHPCSKKAEITAYLTNMHQLLMNADSLPGLCLRNANIPCLPDKLLPVILNMSLLITFREKFKRPWDMPHK